MMRLAVLLLMLLVLAAATVQQHAHRPGRYRGRHTPKALRAARKAVPA